MVGASTLVCGCADGSLIGHNVAALSLRAAGDAPANDAPLTYDWWLDSGTGPQGRGRLCEKRRAFDGWARTAAYEVGLQAVLAKMNQQVGRHHAGPAAPAAQASNAGAAGSTSSSAARPNASVWKRGMRVRLVGLEAKPELNGSIGALLGEIDAESGRVPLVILGPTEHAGKQMKVKPANMLLVT